MQKWHRHPLFSCKLWWRYAAAGVVSKKILDFLFFFTLRMLNLPHQRFSHSNSDIVAICRSILMWISAFFKQRNVLFKRFKRQGGTTFVLELGRNLNFF